MNVSAHRAFNLLKELAYEKVSCSEAETRAANRLLEEALACGVEAHIEEFSVPCGRVHKAKLTVTAPYVKEYEVTGYERAVSTPEGGLEAAFYYAENLLPAHLEQVRGKIVMINGRDGSPGCQDPAVGAGRGAVRGHFPQRMRPHRGHRKTGGSHLSGCPL